MDNEGGSDPNGMEDFDAVTSRSSAKKLAGIISKFDNLKRKLVLETGFGGLLYLPQINVNQRKFNVWLLFHIDAEKRAIVINGESLDMTDRDVHMFLGIPCGPNKLCGIDSKDPEEKMDFIRLAIGSIANNPEEFNSLKAAEEVLTKDYPDGMDAVQQDQFKTSFVCFVIGEFLVAKSKSNHGITEFWGSLLTPKDIPTFNFCTMVIDELMMSARKVQYLIKAKDSIPILSGCTLFLQGFYLMKRKFRNIDRPKNNLPIIAGLDCETIKKMMMADQAARKMMAEVATPTSSAGSKSSYKQLKKPSASALTQLINPVAKIRRTAVTSFLDSYIRGDIERKLSIPQVMDFKWHNARMIHHVTALKKLTEESVSCKSHAVQAEKDRTVANLDKLLGFILEDNVKLAKRMHDHAPGDPFQQSASKNANSSCKRAASQQSYDGSSSDCTSINKKASFGRVGNDCSTDNVASPDIMNLIHYTVDKVVTPLREHAITGTAGQLDASPMVDVATPRSQVVTFKEDDSSFHTPINLKPNVAVTPATTAMHMSESALLYRIMEAEDSFNLNARSLENEYPSSPIEKIIVNLGPVAKNPWEHGVKKFIWADEVSQQFINWLVCNESEELERTWIRHSDPRYIEITGHALKSIYIQGQPFTYEVFDISARRLIQLDRWMYGQGLLLCFSHIFESDFAMLVLANEDPLGFRSIREQFSATLPFYDISKCRLLSVPALVTQTWCAYFWDMELHCVHVIDPTFHRTRADELKNLHDYNVNKIQKALSTCISTIFTGWDIKMADWPNNYVKPIIAGSSENDSGILTLMALRDFNGTGFGLNHDQSTICNFKAFMLYEDLSVVNNNAVLPSGYVKRIDN